MYDQFSVYGQWPDFFFCYSFGSEGLVPEIHLVGKDLIGLSGTFAPSDFQFCFGEVPSAISFDLEFEAATVLRQESRSSTTVVKGDPWYVPEDSHTVTWVGQDVSVSGIVDGATVIYTMFAEFRVMSLPAG
jgi:hypothetical protein